MAKLLCEVCNKEYKYLNQHYDTQTHKNKVEENNKKIREIEEERERLLRSINPRKYDRKKRLRDLLKK